ncbi:unnamed protein product [Fusarium langsethiae]|nr:unnamed protein product [Fusarium langsethiae]
MQPNGPDFKDLAQLSHKPKTLRTLFSKMNTIADGISIISTTEKFNLHAGAEKYDLDFDWTEGGAHYYSETRDELGPTPPVEFVIDILDSAITCNSEHEHEASWNQDVHAPVLKFAFREKDQRLRDQLIRIKNCINAAILPEYQASVPGPSKKVDFVVHICPENDTKSQSPSPAAIAIQRLAGHLPGLMFNFMNVIGLQHQPVAIGIETKKPSEGFEVAKLQMGVWQAAHWAFLRTLIQTQQENEKMRTLQKHVEEQNLATTKEVEVDEQFSQQPETQPSVEPLLQPEETEAEPSNSDSRFNLPEFLPGIIINGHEWWLTISTFENSRVQFYEKKALGSTKDTKEIYKLICALQVLRQWIEESYWPWLKELVLLC